MIQAVPAFEISIGIFAWVASGAAAMAPGENTKPARSFTLSLVMSSVTTVLRIGARWRPFIALDELDLMIAQVLGVKLEIEVVRLVDLNAQVGVGPRNTATPRPP